MKKYVFINKYDIILAAAILIIGIGSLFFMRSSSSAKSKVEIYLGNDIYGSYSLHMDQEIAVETEHGHNIIEIKDGQVSMKDADCSGKDCVRMGSISKEGQIIICAPHKLSVMISGSGKSAKGNSSDSASDIDSVTY